MKNVLDILKERGLLQDVTSPGLRKAVESPVTVYAGFDPSSSSLQVGNLAAIMALAHFQRCGHRVIALVGGGTALVGDPSGKDVERPLLDRDVVLQNVAGIRENLSRFLDLDSRAAPARLVDNADWLGSVGFLDFLRDIGKHFRMTAMLAKESVKARLGGDEGMSFAEFSYQLLQAYDFLKLYDTQGCVLQIGGSDQWGNITAGIDLVRKLRGTEVFGMTLPLICDSEGRKFGKSEGHAVYLDAARTSFYDFYQFFVRAGDADVGRLLKTYTFLPLDEIRALEDATDRDPEQRIAQKKLAEDATRMTHGEAGLKAAVRATSVLFGEAIEGLKAEELLQIFSNVPSAGLTRDRIVGRPVVDVAADAGLCKSKGEARRLIANRGLYVNNRRVDSCDATVSADDPVDGRVLVLRSGRKSFFLVKIV